VCCSARISAIPARRGKPECRHEREYFMGEVARAAAYIQHVRPGLHVGPNPRRLKGSASPAQEVGERFLKPGPPIWPRMAAVMSVGSPMHHGDHAGVVCARRAAAFRQGCTRRLALRAGSHRGPPDEPYPLAVRSQAAWLRRPPGLTQSRADGCASGPSRHRRTRLPRRPGEDPAPRGHAARVESTGRTDPAIRICSAARSSSPH